MDNRFIEYGNYQCSDMENRPALRYTRVNPDTKEIEIRNLTEHLIDLGIYEEPKAERTLTPTLISYYAELKSRIDKLN